MFETFNDFLDSLPAISWIRIRHQDVGRAEYTVAKYECDVTSLHFIAMITALRDELEEAGHANIPVVHSYILSMQAIAGIAAQGVARRRLVDGEV